MRRIGGGLFPAEPKAGELLRKLRPRSPVQVRVMRHRSAAQNSLYWQVLERVVEATGRWGCSEELHAALKIALGRVDVVQLLNGRLVLVPGSIAFDKMSQDEAQRYYDAALRIVCDEIMGGCTVEELLQHASVRAAA